MPRHESGKPIEVVEEQVLGYLNFSSGAHDAQFYGNVDQLFEAAEEAAGEPVEWQTVTSQLLAAVDRLEGSGAAFSDATQARTVVRVVHEHLLSTFLEFHSDLLFHQTGKSMFNSFFVARALEATLCQGGPWDETRRIIRGAISQLNDYIGYRPVATLETHKSEPYPHERVSPVPLFIRGAGAAHGRYQEVVEAALDLLKHTDPDILQVAHFDSEALDELSLDPRAFDFDHPVNKRPNYQFGEWDAQRIDQQGRYRRFIVQQVTMDALMSRVETTSDEPRDDLVFEAAAVLAGTVLMGSGISGWGPGAHDSNVTLGNLVQSIAAYRDAFYERLFERVDGRRAERLRNEAELLKQPFGGARQHLNNQLSRLRASQMEHVHLARLFAQMGHYDSARDEASRVPAPSARMLCQMDCWLTAANVAVERGQIHEASTYLPLIRDLLERAIQCGAVIDPWNILGMDAQFSVFPALENSVHDERADELVSLMHRIFSLYSRIWSESAARHDEPLCAVADEQFRETAEWWQRFAAHEVESVEAVDPFDAYRAAKHVAKALDLWHRGGASAGDVAFWAPHAEMFDSPQAYALVVDALLQRNDFVASMGLLIHWLSESRRVPLEVGEYSFHELAERWMLGVREGSLAGELEAWPLIKRFFECLEVNADNLWRPPKFELQANAPAESPFEETEDPEDAEEGGIYGAAYSEVVYQDSTDDGIDASLHESGSPESHEEIVHEAHRIELHLGFSHCLARLWKLAAVGPWLAASELQQITEMSDVLLHWIAEAARSLKPLDDLMSDVRSYRLKPPQSDQESLLQYDRERLVKESLLESVITCKVEMAEALQFLCAGSIAHADLDTDKLKDQVELQPDEWESVELFGGMLRQDPDLVADKWSEFLATLRCCPLLYVPLAKGGDARVIVETRMRQRRIQNLLAWLPRLGMVSECCELIETARHMERDHPVGAGAVTEFDELFKIGYRAVVECLVQSAESWNDAKELTDDDFMNLLEQFTGHMLGSWLSHSRTLRLSVLEKVREDDEWDSLVRFIQHYGRDLFTQHFLNLGNVRAILHQGVNSWLDQLNQEEVADCEFQVLDDLGQSVSSAEVTDHLSLILEAIVENYGEYRDYNSTTTQSDRGDLLYTLLDFLRLRNEYDRVNWKLMPVVLAHEILVRRGHDQAASMWRRAMAQRTSKRARAFLKQLAKLQQKYAMKMPSVSDRLAEQFVRPLIIDRMRAMVSPAIREVRTGGPCRTFELLHQEASLLTRKPTGAGLDVPTWLIALEEEVHRACRMDIRPDFESAFHEAVTPRSLTRDQTHHQLERTARSNPSN